MNRKARGAWYRMKLKAMLRDESFSMESRYLWALVEGYANQDGSNCYPSVETLMKVSGKCRKWVEKYLKELRGRDMLRVTGKIKTVHGSVNRYQVIFPLTADYGQKKTRTIPPKRVERYTPSNDLPPEFNKPEWKVDENRTAEEPAIYVLPPPEPKTPKKALG